MCKYIAYIVRKPMMVICLLIYLSNVGYVIYHLIINVLEKCYVNQLP